MVFIYNVASYICILCVWLEPIQGLGYEDEVSSYEIVEPVHLGAPNRNRRDLSTRTGEQKQHVEKTRFQVDGFQKQFTLYLHKNRYLLPSSFVLISQRPDGSDFIEKGIEHCYYHGDLGDPETTAVAVDTCNGLRGIIKDEDGEEYYIEPHQYKNKNHSKYFNEHVMYRTKDIKLKKQSVCGHNHTTGEYHDDNIHFPLTSFRNSPYFSDHFRKRRAADGNKYIEVIAVLDKRNFNKHKGSVSATATRGVEVMNYVDLLYKTMNTRIALTGVIVWNVVDKIHVVESAGKTLEAFRKYCVDVLHGLSNLDPDNVQLLSGIDFEGSLVGLAGVGVMCSEGSCAVNQDHSSPAISANTVAHEMGHNLGFFHNGADCICSVKPCVMNAYSSFTQAKGFTSCVTEKYSSILETGSLPCLFDYPDNLYGEPKCGNGFLEKGEACDCGTPEECKASGALTCCSPTTCKLQNTAQCATGPCCKDCQFKSRGTLCRDKFNEDCDLQEYCTGRSSECPNNFVVKDGTTCGGGTAYCFKGTCDSLDTQCQTLWGPNAVKAHDVCFTQNAKAANEWGNCGKDERKQFKPCKEADILCGKLQCAAKDEKNPLPTFPVIGSHRKRNTVKFPHLGDWLICVMGVTSLGDDLDDPTITPDGTKCGENKLCMDQQCVNITTMKHIKSCAKNCLNGGICNSNGHCHCQPGYACPYCQFSGPGGSLDSGQGCMSGGGDGDGLEDCGCLTPLVKGMLILFLLVIPLCVLIAYLCYRNRALVRKRYDAYRHQPQRSRSASSKGLKGRKAQESRDTGVRGETQQDNPYITYAEPSAPTRSALHPPKKFPAREPPSPRPTNVQTSSSNIGYKPNLPAIGGSSPRVAKLPPIKTDSTNVAGKQWPPAPSYKPYR